MEPKSLARRAQLLENELSALMAKENILKVLHDYLSEEDVTIHDAIIYVTDTLESVQSKIKALKR